MRLTLSIILATFLLIGAMAYLGRGQALDFDGTDDEFNVTELVLNDNEPWTVCYWFYDDEATAAHDAMGKTAANANLFRHQDTNTIRVLLDNGSDESFDIPENYRQAWHHLVVTADGSDSTTDSLLMFYDGSVVWSNGNADTELRIQTVGHGTTTAQNHFNGKLADVRIYTNRAFTAREVAALYGQSWRQGTNEVSPSAAAVPSSYYNMDILVDRSGNGRHATNDAASDAYLVKDHDDGSWYGEFDGDQDYYTLGQYNLADNQAYTICYWFWDYGDSNSLHYALGDNDVAGSHYMLHRFVSGTYKRRINVIANQATTEIIAESASAGDWLGAWHHVCYLQNGGNSANYNGWVDAVDEETASGSDSAFQLNDIGDGNTTTSDEWFGRLTQVRVYEREITHAEVTNLYLAGRSAALDAISTNNIVLFYDFEPIMSENLAAHWLAHGTTVEDNQLVDSSANALHAVLKGGLTTKQEDSGDYTGTFDGATDYAEAPHYNIDTNAALSLVLWLIPASSSDGKYEDILTKGGTFENDTTFAFGLRRQVTDKVNFRWRQGATLYGMETESSVVETAEDNQTWVMIAGTMDSSFNAEIYVNDASLSTDTGNAAAGTNAHPIKIGQWTGTQSSSDEYEGKISSARIYQREISATEVTNLYNAGRTAPMDAISTANLIAFWSFSADTTPSVALADGASVKDFSGNNNTGTATNGPVTAESILKKGKGR